jgi:hypothetical protein
MLDPNHTVQNMKLKMEKGKYKKAGVKNRIQAEPNAVRLVPKEKVWLTKSLVADRTTVFSGLYYVMHEGNGKPVLFSKNQGVMIPITPEIRANLAPVRDLQSEALRMVKRDQAGWKLHLNFDSTNEMARQKVEYALQELENSGLIVTWKVGHGGGETSGQPGKEATVYVGDGEKARDVAQYLNQILTGILKPPGSTVLYDDMQLEGNVWGRFDICDDDFMQYGQGGVPFSIDLHKQLFSKRIPLQQAKEQSHAELLKKYGDFYAGAFNNGN